MGMQSSKFGREIAQEELCNGSVPSTPILTPRTIMEKERDPRSPSVHIARTPLEVLSAAAAKLNRETETPMRNKVLDELDPRSPTTEFKRTPIVVEQGHELSRKIFNKHLHKVNLSEMIQTTPNITTEKKSAIPPKLLGSSPLKQRPDAHKRRSLVGLLETNVDFTETDLDKVLQIKDNKETSQCADTGEGIKEVITEHSTATPLVINAEDQEDDGLQQVAVNENAETHEETYTITDQTETKEGGKQIEESIDIVNRVTKSDEEIIYEEHIFERTKLHILHSPRSAPCSPMRPFQLVGVQSQQLTPVVDLTADVKELDKKLTHLIYEDDLVVCPRIVQLRENSGRPALKSFNGNETRSKYSQNLKVSDKPRRSDYAVSKIPVFREKKGIRQKNYVQCENTPPRNMEKKVVKHKRSDWDNKDTTLYL